MATTIREKLSQWDFNGAFDRPSETSYLPLPERTDVAKPELSGRRSAPAVRKDAPRHYTSTKSQLHQKLIARMDLVAAESMSSDQLSHQLGILVNALIEEEKLPLNETEKTQLAIDLQHEILGLGPLEPLLAEPSITEIVVNGYSNVFVERNGRMQRAAVHFNDNAHLLKIIDKIVSRVGRRVDESNPMADARLPDGSRVNAIIPPLALDGPALSIRRFAVTPLQMPDLINKQALTQEMSALLIGLVKAKANILISGGTGSGKTTLLNVLSGFIPSHERIITIEDTAELQLQQEHVVRLETRPPNIEGKGEITPRALVKNSLRMRPDRIVLGEVRGGEVLDMLQAMNTGHDGSLATVHANTPRDALSRLENLVGMGGMQLPAKALREQITSAINVIVQATRLPDGSRKITSIQEIAGMEGDVITMQEIFRFDRQGVGADGRIQGKFLATGVRPLLLSRLRAHGVELDETIFTPPR